MYNFLKSLFSCVFRSLIKDEIVNLDLSPKDRWTHLVTPKKVEVGFVFDIGIMKSNQL